MIADSLFGIELFSDDFWELLARFGFNLLVAFIVIRLIYSRHRHHNAYAFTYFIFNAVIFFVCYLLSNVELQLGFAFGLFALFAILRYRTQTIPIREMTYLFLIITLAVFNSLSGETVSYAELLFSNLAIIILTFVLESYWQRTQLNETILTYAVTDNLQPQNHHQLLDDLRKKTGLEIRKFEVVRIDYVLQQATIKIFFRNPGGSYV